MSYSSVFWLPLCAALTALGVVLSYAVGRRRGNRAMLRGLAWSLIPIAAYLTGSIKMFWQIGDAIGNFASGFVFSPVKWAGIAVAGLIAMLLLATAGRERRKAARAKATTRAAEKADKPGRTAGATGPAQAGLAAGTAVMPTATMPAARQPEPARQAPAAKGSRKGAAAPLDDDMKDIEEILRKRGL
jgi:hypothetical protein